MAFCFAGCGISDYFSLRPYLDLYILECCINLGRGGQCGMWASSNLTLNRVIDCATRAFEPAGCTKRSKECTDQEVRIQFTNQSPILHESYFSLPAERSNTCSMTVFTMTFTCSSVLSNSINSFTFPLKFSLMTSSPSNMCL
jgi:hypothetical protein